jgi:hypothetical protein
MRFFYILLTLLVIGGLLGFYFYEDAQDIVANQVPTETLSATETESLTSANMSAVMQASNQASLKIPNEFNAQKSSGAAGSTDIYNRYAALAQNPNYPSIVDRLNAMSSRKNGKQYNTAEVMAALEQESAWEDTQVASKNLPLSQSEKNDGREFVKFNPLKIDTLMPGDSLALPVKQLNEKFDMVVDRVEQSENGNLTLYGHLNNVEGDNAVTITQSEKNTQATFGTPSGPYELQVFGEAGWIAPSKTNYVDYGSQTAAPADWPAEQTEQQTFPQPGGQPEQAPRQNSQEPSEYE